MIQKSNFGKVIKRLFKIIFLGLNMRWIDFIFCLFSGNFSGESSTKEKSFTDLFKLPLVRWYEALYLYGLVILHLYCTMVHPLTGLARRYPFLPLMMTSVYCALGVMWSWILFYYHTFYDVDISSGKKNN